MSDAISHQPIVQRTVAGCTVTIYESVWPDSRRGYDVHDAVTGKAFTVSGTFDRVPDHGQIATILNGLWTCPACGRKARPDPEAHAAHYASHHALTTAAGLEPDWAAALADLRGSMSSGYDPDDINHAFSRIIDATAVTLVCAWAFCDDAGFGGDSQFYVQTPNGQLYELGGDLWHWLSAHQDDPDAPELPSHPITWTGAHAGAAGQFAVHDGRHNVAAEDRDEHPELAQYAAGVRRLIAQHGWAVQGVVPTDEEDPRHTFAYTVGLTEAGLPELILMGLPPGAYTPILNHLARQSLGQDLIPAQTHDVPVPAGGTQAMRIVDVDESNHHLAGMARAFYHPRLRLLQVLWPSAAGQFPGDSNWPVNAWQPILTASRVRLD